MTSLAIQVARTQQAACHAEQSIAQTVAALLCANGASPELVIAARCGIDDALVALVRAARVLDLVSGRGHDASIGYGSTVRK